MNFDDFDELDEDDLEELEKQIKVQVKIAVKTFEIMWEELQKSNLPEDIKKAILLQYKENK